jgi:hypothetical protein
MSGGVAEVKRDTDYLVAGTYAGASGLTVRDSSKQFKSCGVVVGLAVRNTTDGSSGLITAVGEDYFTCTLSGGTNDAFTADDLYEIYMTSSYNSIKSRHYVDRRYGHKFVNPNDLIEGIKIDEIDVDEYESKVFGPDQPWKDPRGI